MGSHKVVLWNSAGLRASTDSTAAKFSFFDNQFSNAKFSIAAFVETHHKDDQDFSAELNLFHMTHNIVHSAVFKETHSGVILLISKTYDIVKTSDPIPGRLLNVHLREKEHILSLSVFYGPQWGKLTNKEVAEKLEQFDGLHELTYTNMILGDFNFVDYDIDKGKG